VKLHPQMPQMNADWKTISSADRRSEALSADYADERRLENDSICGNLRNLRMITIPAPDATHQ
jgi:hypothetical protein